MQQLESLLTQIIEHKKRLDELKAQSPEMAEALALSDLYHGLMEDLRQTCNPPSQIVPMPYPVYPPMPTPIWQKWDVTCATPSLLPTTLQVVK